MGRDSTAVTAGCSCVCACVAPWVNLYFGVLCNPPEQQLEAVGEGSVPDFFNNMVTLSIYAIDREKRIREMGYRHVLPPLHFRACSLEKLSSLHAFPKEWNTREGLYHHIYGPAMSGREKGGQGFNFHSKPPSSIPFGMKFFRASHKQMKPQMGAASNGPTHAPGPSALETQGWRMTSLLGLCRKVTVIQEPGSLAALKAEIKFQSPGHKRGAGWEMQLIP